MVQVRYKKKKIGDLEPGTICEAAKGVYLVIQMPNGDTYAVSFNGVQWLNSEMEVDHVVLNPEDEVSF